jgi:hypothetical protein
MKGYETFPPARNGSRNCRRDHTIKKYVKNSSSISYLIIRTSAKNIKIIKEVKIKDNIE